MEMEVIKMIDWVQCVRFVCHRYSAPRMKICSHKHGSACTGSSETHAGNGLCLEAVEEIAARLSGFFFVRMFVCLWGVF